MLETPEPHQVCLLENSHLLMGHITKLAIQSHLDYNLNLQQIKT